MQKKREKERKGRIDVSRTGENRCFTRIIKVTRGQETQCSNCTSFFLFALSFYLFRCWPPYLAFSFSGSYVATARRLELQGSAKRAAQLGTVCQLVERDSDSIGWPGLFAAELASFVSVLCPPFRRSRSVVRVPSRSRARQNTPPTGFYTFTSNVHSTASADLFYPLPDPPPPLLSPRATLAPFLFPLSSVLRQIDAELQGAGNMKLDKRRREEERIPKETSERRTRQWCSNHGIVTHTAVVPPASALVLALTLPLSFLLSFPFRHANVVRTLPLVFQLTVPELSSPLLVGYIRPYSSGPLLRHHY